MHLRKDPLVRIVTLTLCLSHAAAASETARYDLLTEQGAPVVVVCQVSASPVAGGHNALFIHGANHNREVFSRVIASLMERAEGPEALPLNRACALDLPGHGDAGPMDPSQFAAMGLEEYADVVEDVLDQAKSHEALGADGAIDTLVGHSLGGMLVQMIADRALDEECLGTHWGIQDVMLLSPTLPEGVPWGYADLSDADPGPRDLVSALRMLTPQPPLGAYVELPPDMFVKLFLLYDPQGQPWTFNRADVEMLSDVETLRAWGQLYGIDPSDPESPGERPVIAKGALENEHLVTVSFEHDHYMQWCEIEDLQAYLHGDTPVAGAEGSSACDAGEDMLVGSSSEHFHVNSPAATHDGFFLDPRNAELQAAFTELLAP